MPATAIMLVQRLSQALYALALKAFVALVDHIF